jgi:SOS-response transcriptional repressor LexA
VTTSGELRKHVKMRVREAERFAVSVMSQLRLESGATVDALICNLSTRGFMVNSPDYIPVDSLVKLVVPGIGPCEASVVWSFCGDTGGCFTDPIDLDLYWEAIRPDAEPRQEPVEPVSASQHLGRYFERGAERIKAEGTFRLKAESDSVVDAEICDISTLGLKGTCAGRLSIGSLVTVDIPGIGPVDAEVKWQLAGQFGAMFLEPIDLQSCEWSAVKARFRG